VVLTAAEHVADALGSPVLVVSAATAFLAELAFPLALIMVFVEAGCGEIMGEVGDLFARALHDGMEVGGNVLSGHASAPTDT
jgi:hypothetical protein